MRPVSLRWCKSFCPSTLSISTEQCTSCCGRKWQKPFSNRFHCSIHQTVQMCISALMAHWPADTGMRICIPCNFSLTPGHHTLTPFHMIVWPDTFNLMSLFSEVRKVLAQQMVTFLLYLRWCILNARLGLWDISIKIAWPTRHWALGTQNEQMWCETGLYKVIRLVLWFADYRVNVFYQRTKSYLVGQKSRKYVPSFEDSQTHRWIKRK